MSLTSYIPPSKSMTDIRNQDPNLVAQKWNTAAILNADNTDDLSQLEGAENSDSPIQIKQDLAAGGGDTVNFSVFGDLGGSGKRGSDELLGYTEQPIEHTFNVVVDQVRHGISDKALVRQMTATGRSREAIEVELLGRWFGRKKKNDAFMRFILGAQAGNTLRPDGKQRDSLLTTDTISASFISDAGAFLTTLNASPGRIGKAESGADIFGYLFYSDQAVLRPLKDDDTYLQATRYSDVRGTDNVLFKGGFRQWDANTIWDAKVPDLTTYGPLGSALAPKALLGASGATSIDFSATNSTVVIYGSGVNNTNLGNYSAYYEPFQFFPGYSYTFTKKDAAINDTATRYVMLYDPADGKWCPMSYTGNTNTGNQITIGNRLAAASSGSRATSFMGFTWDSSKNKEVFPVGSWVIPVNAKGVAFGYTLALGRAAMFRAFGNIKMQRIKNVTDFEEDTGVGIKSIYGQNVPVDALQRVRNYLLIETAVNHPGITLPAVTS